MKFRQIAIAAAFVTAAATGYVMAASSDSEETWALSGESWALSGPKLSGISDRHVSGYQWLFNARSGTVRLCRQDAATTIWECSTQNIGLGPGWHFQKAESLRTDARFPVAAQFLNSATGDLTYCRGTNMLTYQCGSPSV